MRKTQSDIWATALDVMEGATEALAELGFDELSEAEREALWTRLVAISFGVAEAAWRVKRQ